MRADPRRRRSAASRSCLDPRADAFEQIRPPRPTRASSAPVDKPPMPRPRALQVQRRRWRAASASASRRRSTRSRPRRDPIAPRRPARRPRAGRAPPGCRAAPKVLRAQCLPDPTRESDGQRAGDLPPPRLQQRQRVQGERVEEPAAGVRAFQSASTRMGSRSPVGGTGMPSTSPSECAWSVETISTRSPARASRTAVAVANVDLPTPPLPTKRLIRAEAAAPAAAAKLTQPRLVSSDPSMRCRSAAVRPCA